MIQQIMKAVLTQDITEEPDELFDGLVGALSVGSAQGLGSGVVLSEMVAAAGAKRNTRKETSE